MFSCFSCRLLVLEDSKDLRAPASTPLRKDHGTHQTRELRRRCLVIQTPRRQGGAGGDPGAVHARGAAAPPPPPAGRPHGRAEATM